MKPSRTHLLVLMTAPDLKTARRIVRRAVVEGAAACGNIVPRVESIYRWKGKVETGAEALVLFKTTRSRLAALEALVVALHPYDTPELVALPIGSGTRKYLAWIDAAVG